MKGEIFNIFERFVEEQMGIEVWEDVYDASLKDLETQEPFVGPGTYPDADFMTLVLNATKLAQLPLEAAVRSFGRYSFRHLAAKIPEHVDSFSHPKPLLKTVHQIIHVEVKKVFLGAEPPAFTYYDEGPTQLRMRYSSKRRLYAFVEGIIEGAGEYYGVPTEVSRGTPEPDGSCDFTVVFATAEPV